MGKAEKDLEKELYSYAVSESMKNAEKRRDEALHLDPNLSKVPQAPDLAQDIIFATVACFRDQRLNSVQTFRQFVFIYEAILWALLYRKIKGTF